jgi:hypothetical protein
VDVAVRDRAGSTRGGPARWSATNATRCPLPGRWTSGATWQRGSATTGRQAPGPLRALWMMLALAVVSLAATGLVTLLA